MSIRNHALSPIDFGFAELRSGSSLAPYPKGCEEPNTASGGARCQNQLLPLGSGQIIDFQV